MARIERLERYDLEDGFISLSRLGKGYFVTRGYRDDTPPDTSPNMSKARAYNHMADIMRENILGS